MVGISISPEFRSYRQEVRLGCLVCNVAVSAENELLWRDIDRVTVQMSSTFSVDEISEHPAIAASRKVYRALGKDPARYRLSSEALMRRILKGNDLYRVNNVVDIVNLVSIKTGFSIGGYDLDLINLPVNLSVGLVSDEYQAIGRGELNIESLPVLRDAEGAFGSPTSDSLRTSVTVHTRRFFMVVFGFGYFDKMSDTLNFAESLLLKYAGATAFEKWIVKT